MRFMPFVFIGGLISGYLSVAAYVYFDTQSSFLIDLESLSQEGKRLIIVPPFSGGWGSVLPGVFFGLFILLLAWRRGVFSSQNSFSAFLRALYFLLTSVFAHYVAVLFYVWSIAPFAFEFASKGGEFTPPLWRTFLPGAVGTFILLLAVQQLLVRIRPAVFFLILTIGTILGSIVFLSSDFIFISGLDPFVSTIFNVFARGKNIARSWMSVPPFPSVFLLYIIWQPVIAYMIYSCCLRRKS